MKYAKLLYILFIITVPNIIYTSEKAREQKASSFDDRLVRFPKKEILKERLKKIGFHKFDEQTDLVESLVYGRFNGKNPIGIGMIVETSYDIFIKNAISNGFTRQETTKIIINKSLLYKTLLQNHPNGLQEIEDAGLYHPIPFLLVKSKSI